MKAGWLRKRRTRDVKAGVRPILVAVFVIAVLPPLVLWVAHTYTGAVIWPGIVGNTTGSLVAFVLALEFERRRDIKQARDAVERDTDRRREEARRRLRLLESELVSHEKDLEEIGNALARREPVIFPLTVGAWAASAEALVRLLARPELVAEFSNYYDRAEELETLLHQRGQSHPNSEVGSWLTTAASDLWRDLGRRLRELLPQVRDELANPAVQEHAGVSSFTLARG